MTLKVVLLTLAAIAILWRRMTDSRLSWTVLAVLASVFLSRVYWLTPVGTLRLEQLACVALFVHFLIDLFRQRRWPRFGTPALLLLGLLPLMIASSLLASPFPAASLRKTLIYFPYIGGLLALCHFLNSESMLDAAWDFLVRFGTCILGVALAGYFLFLVGIDLGMTRVQAGVIWLRGSLVNPNIFSAAATLVLIPTLVRFLFQPRSSTRYSVFDLVALAISSASLVVGFSRASWILALMATVVIFFYARRDRSRWLPALSVLLVSVVITIAITVVGSTAYNAKLKRHPELTQKSLGEFGEPVLDGFNSAPRASSVPTATPFKQRLLYNQSSLRWRFSISSRALRDWLKSPVLGRGTDSLMLLHPSIPQYYVPVTWVVILHDWGIFAFVLYVAFLLLTGLRLWRRLPHSPLPAGLIFSVFLVFLFQTIQTQVSTTLQLGSFWVLAAVFIAAGRPAVAKATDDRRPLRVGFDAKWFFSDTSSSRVMVRNLLGELIARKKDIELFLFLRRCDRRRDFPHQGQGVHCVYVAGRPNLLANLITVPWRAWRLNLDVGVFQYFAPPFSHCRRLVIIHDIIFSEHPEYFLWAERLYFSPMRWLARRAQAIATISRTEKSRLVRHGFGKEGQIEVIYPGVDPRFKPLAEIPARLREDVRCRYGLPPRFLLYLGRLNVRKNISGLLKALAMLEDQTIPLVLAGRSQGRVEHIEAEAERLRLKKRLVRLGFIADDDLPVLLAMATIFCYVSHDEGFGLPVLEAMACGVPVVVSHSRVMEEICGPAGNYVEQGDPQAITAMIDRLLADPEARRQKASQGLVHCRQFSWGRSADALLTLCRRLDHEASAQVPAQPFASAFGGSGPLP